MPRAKKQSRRSISVKGEIYEKVKKYCDEHNISMSAFVEERITEYLNYIEKGAPLPYLTGAVEGDDSGKEEEQAVQEPERSVEEIEREASQYFTF